ncbi:MAG: nucleotidyltransferase domain-containing protein [Candidatus Micrarchaeia archaeon]|jgi:predicted nucleotidyltransferase
MLEFLFGSKSRLAVLRVLSLHPEGVYLRQVAHLAGIQPISAKRELDLMARAGVLEERKSGQQRFFYPTKDNSIATELFALVRKDAVPVILANALSKVRGIQKCFVYGSVAKAQDTARSDVDVMIIGSPDSVALAKAVAAAEKTLGRQVNASVFSQKEYSERLGKKNAFIMRVESEPKLLVIGEDAKNSGTGKRRPDRAVSSHTFGD